MLGQTTAVLVALSALVATELDAAVLSALLDQRLAVAGSPNPGLLEVGLAVRDVVEIVFNGASLHFHLPLWVHESVCRQAGGWGRQAAGQSGPRGARLGHGVAASPQDGQRRSLVTRLLHGGGDRGNIGGGIGHALAPGDAMVGIERTREDRVRVVA